MEWSAWYARVRRRNQYGSARVPLHELRYCGTGNQFDDLCWYQLKRPDPRASALDGSLRFDRQYQPSIQPAAGSEEHRLAGLQPVLPEVPGLPANGDEWFF